MSIKRRSNLRWMLARIRRLRRALHEADTPQRRARIRQLQDAIIAAGRGNELL